MFGSKEKFEFETESVIGKGTEFKGTLKDKDSICIDGKIEGKIQVEGNVIVGEDAIVKADIQAKSISIGGKVIGNVDCQGKVELFPSGGLEGNVKAHGLIIPKGAFFNGKCRMIPFEENKKQKPVKNDLAKKQTHFKGEETKGKIAIKSTEREIRELKKNRKKHREKNT